MTMSGGRKLVHEGAEYFWKLKYVRPSLPKWSPDSVRLVVRASAEGMFQATFKSKRWTSEHEWNRDCAPVHKAAFRPADVSRCIAVAKAQGWDPGRKGGVFTLDPAPDLTDYGPET